MELPEYVNQPPEPEQKSSSDANSAERRILQVLLLSFGLLCVTQAVLNVTLRLTRNWSPASSLLDPNTTHLGGNNVKSECEEEKPSHCNTLQERFNALTREKNLLENRVSELTNEIRNVRNDRDKLQKELSELKGCGSPQLCCPADWFELNSRCYFLSTEEKTWEESRAHCQSQGGDLVVINSSLEQESLYRINRDPYLLFWIGLRNVSGSFIWVDGSYPGRGFWQPGQPGDGGPNNREDCVEMYHANPKLANWNDAPCQRRRNWMCERDPIS